MRKYLQISVVLGTFFLVVYIKNMKVDDRTDVVRMPLPSPIPKVVITGPPSPGVTAAPTAQPVILGKYKDGTYDGTVEDAFYGNLQVQAIIKNGKIADVVPLLYPNDNRTSILINTQAIQMLKDEAIQKQDSQVDIISGASDSSPAFSRSLASALKKAL